MEHTNDADFDNLTEAELDDLLREAGLSPELIEQEAAALIERLRAAHVRRPFKVELLWRIKQLLPLRYESQFKENDKSILCIWQMWMGRCFNVRSFHLAD